MKKYLAFDIGGTFIKYAIVTEAAEIMESGKAKTPASLTGLIDLIDGYAVSFPDAAGIAISAPGAVSEKGVVYGSSALDYIHGPNIKEMITERTQLSVFMENDANCAGYAEVWDGSAKGKSDVLAVVIGTGIGGAVIKNGLLHKGAHLHGGEFGYMLINTDIEEDDNTWSGKAATAALVKAVEKKKQLADGTLSGEEVFAMAEQGDKDCEEAIDHFYHYLAVGIYNLQYIFDPEIILIGGGISAREDLIERINEKLDMLLAKIKIATVKPRIDVCKFRQNANLLGAVYGFLKENHN
ncbi:ROK family protein [Sediminibacillus albus]|uniref:Sugar kinase of the NBD/HSP70 family, may contain an N-terminal HTH domain n=1 Tax=Sediminibacillus albus TaxID=407036 RepID=A0A1G8WI42_9BACI|nr:ROK family protein [Sediminibacillus albus]SDJ77999.1 Sugar kinase of the NBD/HSP70 family, may contain an N-terminal HTH domain [Sediminibacillus albus]